MTEGATSTRAQRAIVIFKASTYEAKMLREMKSGQTADGNEHTR